MAAPRCEEMASSSMSSPRSSSDSLNGLQFGHKIYFCDVGLGGGGGPSSAASTPPGKKGQPPRCQVEGCDVDLSDAKAYYSRHKVCCPHSKSSKVVVGGIQQRFCQQCSRFHQVAEFDNDKRSCRRRLAGHNERRRKPPPGSLLSNRLGRLSPSVFADGGSSSNSSNGFLVDFTSSLKAPPGSGRSSWPGTTKAPENHQQHQQGAWAGGAHTYLHQSSATGGVGAHNYPVGPSIPSGECFAGVTDSSCALSLLSSQGWSSGNHRAPPPPLNTVHFPDNNTNNHNNNNNNPWSFKVCEASQGLSSATSNLGLGQLPRDHHHLPSRSSGNDLDMGQSGGGPTGRQLIEFEHSVAYGSSSSTDHMNWLL